MIPERRRNGQSKRPSCCAVRAPGPRLRAAPAPGSPCLHRLDHAPLDLVALDGLEQRLEIALAETIVALALNVFKERSSKNIAPWPHSLP
jgi:hypothetical protein